MEVIYEFIIEHKELLILGVACLLDLILFLVGCFKRKDHSVLDDVIYMLPVFIKEAEEAIGSGNGELKFGRVLKNAIEHYYKLSGVRIKENSLYARVLKDQIESILETPTKKGK